MHTTLRTLVVASSILAGWTNLVIDKFCKRGIIIIMNIKSKKLGCNNHLRPIMRMLKADYGCSFVKIYHRQNKCLKTFVCFKVITNKWKETFDYLGNI